MSKLRIRKCLFPAAGYGTRFDCGSIDGFVEATNYFYNKKKI